MSFSINNPDVDPLSQSQRINILERRPSGGGGAGGGGPYTIPNFDLYPDNAIKFYPDVGLVGKITIPPSPQVIPNVEFKACFYRPVLSGGPFGPTFFFMREYNSSDWSVPINPNTGASIKLNQDIDCEDYFQDYIAQTNYKLVVVLNMQWKLPFRISGGGYTTVDFRFNVTIAPPSKPGGAASYINLITYVSSSYKPPAYIIIPVAYRFSYTVRQMDGSQPFYILLPNSVDPTFLYSTTDISGTPTVTVAALQDLSSAYTSLYPQSWTTP